jgi:DNA-binding NarL/FixJ family response regulator
VFKKRPRKVRRAFAPHRPPRPGSKLEPGYWQRRLFKNTYTYKGKVVKARGWSVKMQLVGKRQTFSLASQNRGQAAAEACGIYQTVLGQGWKGLARPSARAGLALRLRSEVERLSPRLIHRKHLGQRGRHGRQEFSVRIEHNGTSRYFPLGTADGMKASAQAKRIQQAVLKAGWAEATQRFPCELTLALRWLDAPVFWTYTTILTPESRNRAEHPERSNSNLSALRLAIVEQDSAVRLALESCAAQPEGFTCCASYASAGAAFQGLVQQQADLVLINYDLAHEPGAALLPQLQRGSPGLVSLLYSVFEDSDELFKGTPGGAAIYILKRTPPFQILDPIKNALKKDGFTRERLGASVRHYFQEAFGALPVGPPSPEMAKLTPREHEILTLLAKGALDKEIAESLRISVWTVHGHVKNIFEKLGVHTRTEAVLKYLHK